ncbi:Arylesterase [Sulfidibacter corallicola]|uniref:Arylesterase n=1 Tax=Sulfidibacter corallicola TaxID=2818388 RepID=A0A8A4TG87_SULCO|nr:arylesterase [Sulfidibacter corallicola]QTD47791.1 arylesterase [Sulfidibacter corallicola]
MNHFLVDVPISRKKWLLTVLLWVATTALYAADEPQPPRVLVLGDSLTAGYGLGKEFAFPEILQKKADSAGLSVTIVNAGVSGDTSAGGLRRIDWMLRRPVDVLLLELGANDGLRGVAVNETTRNLQAIIDKTKAKYPAVKIVIAGMMVPPNLGETYSRDFAGIFTNLAKNNGAVLIPFLLEKVAGRPELNLEDGIHPTEEGHKLIAETVWPHLEPVLRGL